jgi:FixJ family two-component response regulator
MVGDPRSIVAIVDDDLRVLESLEDLLESAGHSVRPFASAKALLENDCFLEIDCLIADIGMPVMDGFELQRLARGVRPMLPIILITGRHEVLSRRPPVTEGGQEIFQKPFDGPTLLAAVSRALQRPSEREQS